MHVLCLDEIPSTSSHAHDLLKDETFCRKQPVPFAVVAKTQTAGRGQRGADWQSPAGNIYLSLVLPADQMSYDDLARVPLWAGWQTALFIQENFSGIRCTIKWPNDLLFAGRKIAGVLCESVSGAQMDRRFVIVGVGCNVRNAPNPWSIAINDILKLSDAIDPVVCAEMLATQLARAWPNFTVADWWSSYDQFAIPSGEVFFDRDGGQNSYLLTGLTAKGECVVQDLNSGTQEVLNSAGSAKKWRFQRTERQDKLPPFAVADVGNSRVKLAVYASADDPCPEWRYQIMGLSLRDCPNTINDVLSKIRNQVGVLNIASVNAGYENLLRDVCEKIHLPITHIPKRPLRVNFANYNFSELGIDRVAICEGLFERCVHGKAEQNFLGISLGTAATFDVLRGDAKHLGGWIIPGVEAMQHGLHLAAPALPTIDSAHWGEVLSSTDQFLGTTSRTSIERGIREIYRSMTAKLIERFQIHSENILITGGQGEWLARDFPGVRYDADFILHGLRLMSVGGIFYQHDPGGGHTHGLE